jgi:hypothetical protein
MTRLKGGAKQGKITGNGNSIFDAITQGGQSLPSGAVRMPNGTIIFKHVSVTTGEFTIDINAGGNLYKIRINP